MLKVNVFEAKARLSELMTKAIEGERVVICRRNEPLVELTPVGQLRADARPMGLARGRGSIPESFFDPMSEDELRAFEDGAVYPESRTKKKTGGSRRR